MRVPALILAGSRDAASVAASRDLADLLPGARLEILEGAGHVANLEQPDAWNARVAAFLAAP